MTEIGQQRWRRAALDSFLPESRLRPRDGSDTFGNDQDTLIYQYEPRWRDQWHTNKAFSAAKPMRKAAILQLLFDLEFPIAWIILPTCCNYL